MKVNLSDITAHEWANVARIFGNMRSLEIDGFSGEAEIDIDEVGKVTIVMDKPKPKLKVVKAAPRAEAV